MARLQLTHHYFLVLRFTGWPAFSAAIFSSDSCLLMETIASPKSLISSTGARTNSLIGLFFCHDGMGLLKNQDSSWWPSAKITALLFRANTHKICQFPVIGERFPFAGLVHDRQANRIVALHP